MSDVGDLTGPRVSALQNADGTLAADGVNDKCHGNTDGVQPNDKAILANVGIVLICWGQFYEDHSDALEFARQLCDDLVTGRYFNGLAQYGIGRGTVVEGGNSLIPPPPKTLNEDEARDMVIQNIEVGPTKPAVDESSLLYVILLPTDTTPTISSGETKFCGYHGHTKFNDASRNDDLFYVIVRTDTADHSSGQALVRSVSFCLSHEIAEAVTNRDGRGYHGATCEIGDLCEQNGTFQYPSQAHIDPWKVEQYWSQWDRTCIHGDNPVSISQFLKAIGRTGESLRALGTPIINIEFIASQFR